MATQTVNQFVNRHDAVVSQLFTLHIHTLISVSVTQWTASKDWTIQTTNKQCVCIHQLQWKILITIY